MFPWFHLQRQLRWLNRERRRLQRLHAMNYSTAEKAGKSREELWPLIETSSRDYSHLDDQIIEAETSYLFEIAYRLRIPTPDYARKDLWVINGINRRLTDSALADFRAAIWKEQTERWQYWELRLKVVVVVFTGLTGVLGALIGLIATFKK